jgi:hypothetical protein
MKKTLNTALALGFGVLAPWASADGLLAVDNPANNGTATSAYAVLEAFAGNDQVAMWQFDKDWQGSYSPRHGRKIGLLAVRSEAGAQWNGYRLGVLYRAEALMQTNRDSADLMRQYKNSSGYETGRTYQIDGRLRGFEADGVRLGKSLQLSPGARWRLNMGAGASWLHGKRVRLDTAAGQVTATTAKIFDANARWDSADSEMDTSGAEKFNPPFGAHPSFSGQGFALDLGIVLRRDDGLRLEAAVNDLAARMYWKNVPVYAANYNTATKTFDANGFVRFDAATAQAQSSYSDLNQKLDPKVWLAAAYPIAGFEVQAGASYTQGYWFPQAGLAYQVNSQWGLKADYDVRFKTVGIGLRHRSFQLRLRTDNTSIGKAKAYGLSGAANIAF